MKQKLSIFVVLILVSAVLIGLNAASYTQKEKTPDTESSPNRSTFNAGSTGSQAFYTLLSETGRRVVRWQESPAALHTVRGDGPAVFVITGNLKRDFTDIEVGELLRWVSGGGRLVVIDRDPPKGLATTTASWRIRFQPNITPELYSVDAGNANQMVADAAAVRPVQPSGLTENVNSIQASKFASFVQFERLTDGADSSEDYIDEAPDVSTETPRGGSPFTVESPSETAPAVHFAAGGNNLIVDAPFGEGRIIFAGDPYIVSNAGISLVDNAQLAVNLVAAGEGTIAFDEYHQGYGNDSNRFLQFFAGTPVVAIFLQGVLLTGLVFFSQSRRFARAVPEPEPDRLSKLEYVSAMAELQGRTKAFDLAVENIYTEFRRRVTRHLGLDNLRTSVSDVALMIHERSEVDRGTVETTMHDCEEIIRGEPTSKREVVRLIAELRSIELKLGLTRGARRKS